MKKFSVDPPVRNIGFVSTRLAGTDGVSLETEKWASVMERAGLECYYFAGELERPPERSYLAETAHFAHPEILDINASVFGGERRDAAVSRAIHRHAAALKEALAAFVRQYDIQVLIPENALTIPMNIPLGIALTELIAETGIYSVAHHHDFYWERDRYMVNGVSDYLRMAFPPVLPTLEHIVINTPAQEQLGLRTGMSSRVIPNVMDFAHPPAPPDEYAADAREALGVADDELLVLQPTRVVQRKGIEHAIELVGRMGRKAKLVISHASGDEGYDYEQRLREYSELMQVDTLFVSDIIDERRGTTPDGRKIYTLQDIYPHADLVTYPSTFEGFGNAFLESIYFRKPIVVNAYSIYTKDIKPKGFQVIELDGYVTHAAVDQALRVLDDDSLRREMVEHNYRLGERYYSYAVLQRNLREYMMEHNWFA